MRTGVDGLFSCISRACQTCQRQGGCTKSFLVAVLSWAVGQPLKPVNKFVLCRKFIRSESLHAISNKKLLGVCVCAYVCVCVAEGQKV